MDICKKHRDYIRNVRRAKKCNLECCTADDKKTEWGYCDHYKQGLPEIFVSIVMDDITLVQHQIQQKRSQYKTIRQYTKNFDITPEELKKILNRKMRRDRIFYMKVSHVNKLLDNPNFTAVATGSNLYNSRKRHRYRYPCR